MFLSWGGLLNNYHLKRGLKMMISSTCFCDFFQKTLGIQAHLLRMVSWNLNKIPCFSEVIVHPKPSSSDMFFFVIPRERV